MVPGMFIHSFNLLTSFRHLYIITFERVQRENPQSTQSAHNVTIPSNRVTKVTDW